MRRYTSILLWMLMFVGLVGAVGLLLFQPLSRAFMANPAFNGIILGVLVVGIFVNLRQVLILGPERAWIERFRRSDPEKPVTDVPRLLAPMARMLAQRQRGQFSLSPLSARSMLDSIRMRLDESREIARYLIGLLIFLGLLGTFWGLLTTVSAVGDVIQGLSVGGEDGVAVFERLKSGLEGPLGGMGTAFSSSLFGLAGALVLGFLDLQAGHAQNRFFNDLEEWLSGATRVSSGTLPGDGEYPVPAYIQALLEQTADNIERLSRTLSRDEEGRRLAGDRQAAMTEQLAKLTEQLREQDAGRDRVIEELRAEIRLLAKALARDK